MEWTECSLIGGDTRRIEIIGKCRYMGGKHMDAIGWSGTGLIRCHGHDRLLL